MANDINLIAFGTFGHPNGFKQTFFFGSKDLAKSVKTFDLNTNAIKLFANSKVYAIRKEYANGFNTIAYSVYSYAREQNSDRSGTFIGSSILYTNRIAKEHITIAQLNDFHKQLVKNNVLNDTISVNHSDKFSVAKPKDFDKIEFHLREMENVNFSQNTEKYLVVFCKVDDNDLNRFFAKSLDLLNVYDTIYFTDNQEVAEFVHQKGVFKFIQNVGEKRDFDKELNYLSEERKRVRERSILEFKREIQQINEDKFQVIQDFKLQIEQSEKTHLENARMLKESLEDIKRIGQVYDDFLNKTNGLINQLSQNNLKLDEVKQVHNSNKILFNNGIVELKRPNYTNTLAKPKPKGNLPTEQQRPHFEHGGGHKRSGEREFSEKKALKNDIFKVSTIVLTSVLFVSWLYFFFEWKLKNDIVLTRNSGQVDSNTGVQIQNSVDVESIEELRPKSNSMLNENDYGIVARYLKKNMKLEEVVKVIFTKNSTDIGSIYSGQESIYSKQLLVMNKDCFDEKEGIFYLTKDTLKLIPSFKK